MPESPSVTIIIIAMRNERKCIREYFLTISVGKRVDNNDMKI